MAREGDPLLLPPGGSWRVSCTPSALVSEVAHTARLNLVLKGALQLSGFGFHSHEVFIICMGIGTGKESIQDFDDEVWRVLTSLHR